MRTYACMSWKKVRKHACKVLRGKEKKNDPTIILDMAFNRQIGENVTSLLLALLIPLDFMQDFF